ncbi:hypothetical protein NDU88_003733 [Pleurodeles waltl]|uniref:Uncharacterized protein n=1 Tax=Pleurodeles waltl TaxID=8319 RepID=A0AAV7RER6_PLEWA|nr:hypothetical protein NDU88_003733 [Pleurodeles waltl]
MAPFSRPSRYLPQETDATPRVLVFSLRVGPGTWEQGVGAGVDAGAAAKELQKRAAKRSCVAAVRQWRQGRELVNGEKRRGQNPYQCTSVSECPQNSGGNQRR